MFWHTYESGCSARYAMPAELFVLAEVCFKRRGARTCLPVSFMQNVREVVLSIP